MSASCWALLSFTDSSGWCPTDAAKNARRSASVPAGSASQRWIVLAGGVGMGFDPVGDVCGQSVQ